MHIDGDQLTDNYDYALYRSITAEDYNSILEQTVPYLDAEKQFAALYEKWAMEADDGKRNEYEQNLEQMGQADNVPVYQIYKNNCDHVARMLASSVDSELQNYTNNAWRMTPNGNFKAFGRKVQDWGVMTLGKQSTVERILMFLMIF